MGRSWTSSCSISRHHRSTSSGTCSTSRMQPSLPGLSACCMSPYWGCAPQKRPDPSGSIAGNRARRGLKLFRPLKGMTAMRNDLTMRLRLGLIAGACALLTLGNVAHAQQAQDDDEDTFEQRVIKGILGGLGVNVGGAGIDYRERSPL